MNIQVIIMNDHIGMSLDDLEKMHVDLKNLKKELKSYSPPLRSAAIYIDIKDRREGLTYKVSMYTLDGGSNIETGCRRSEKGELILI